MHVIPAQFPSSLPSLRELILAATSPVHGLAHLEIAAAIRAKPNNAEHAARLAREATSILGAGLLPRRAPPNRRR